MNDKCCLTCVLMTNLLRKYVRPWIPAAGRVFLALALALLIWGGWKAYNLFDYWLPKIYAELQDSNPMNETIWTGRIGEEVW